VYDDADEGTLKTQDTIILIRVKKMRERKMI